MTKLVRVTNSVYATIIYIFNSKSYGSTLIFYELKLVLWSDDPIYKRP